MSIPDSSYAGTLSLRSSWAFQSISPRCQCKGIWGRLAHPPAQYPNGLYNVKATPSWALGTFSNFHSHEIISKLLSFEASACLLDVLTIQTVAHKSLYHLASAPLWPDLWYFSGPPCPFIQTSSFFLKHTEHAPSTSGHLHLLSSLWRTLPYLSMAGSMASCRSLYKDQLIREVCSKIGIFFFPPPQHHWGETPLPSLSCFNCLHTTFMTWHRLRTIAVCKLVLNVSVIYFCLPAPHLLPTKNAHTIV